MKDVVLLVAHQINKKLIEKYFCIKKQFLTYGDTVLLLHCEGEIIIPEGVDCSIFTVDLLNRLRYNPICETIVPGSNHFALLWFYLNNSDYRYYWNIEYDVAFSGEWQVLYDEFFNVDADFISTHIRWYKEARNWPWWNSYESVSKEILLEKRIKSFNPIYRVSARALCFLDDFLKEGNSGHHEVLIPSILYHSDFKIVDFGGRGSFVPLRYEEKFYLLHGSNNSIRGGTMRYRPSFSEIDFDLIKNKLFHPIKIDEDCMLPFQSDNL